jgi:serine/threonine protein phosphatase PrpC
LLLFCPLPSASYNRSTQQSIMGESNSNTTESNKKESDKKQEICVDDDEKSHSFRRRRLTYAKHHLAASPGDHEDDSSVDTEKSRTFRDRRLTLPHHHADKEHAAATDHDDRKDMKPSPRKKLKTATASKLQSRIHHAGHLPPVSPRTQSSHPLYTTLNIEPLETEEDRASIPAWRHRHTRPHDEQDHHLPFPRHVVGTYSVHGVEPVYDSEYEDIPDDDEDWMEPANVGNKTKKPKEEGEKLTTVAKINQDRGGVAYPYANSNRTALFAAYDGHGQGGELVSQYALHEVQRRLEKHPDFYSDIEKAFKETFITVDEDLTKEPLIEPLYAGTTACVVLIRDKKMVISNAGDSRAVLARRKKKGAWEALDLSQDQNPDVPEEQERIEKAGGFVSPPPEPGLSARVWLDNTYSQIGLAMARSIGDHAVAPVGVIAEPVVTSHTIEENDDFLILATDGVWEFIDSDEAVRIVGEHLSNGATKACQALIEAAASKWHEEEGNYRDDITALVVRLQDLWGSASS